jgi:RNA polymerase sigma factor (sigma-70 family)
MTDSPDLPRDDTDQPQGGEESSRGHSQPSGPAPLETRRERLRLTLASAELHRALHIVMSRCRWETSRWDEQLMQVDALLSDVAERALEHAERFDPDRSGPIPWLMGIALNLLREQRRFVSQERQQLVAQHTLGEENWRAILDRLMTPPREPGDSPVDEEIGQALAGLPSEQRKVLELRYLQDLSWPEVANKLGVSEGAARVRGCRALQVLRDRLYPEPRREH